MPKLIDLVGKRYGRLIVLENRGKDKNRNYYWLCRCDCGNEKVVMGENLKRGLTKSCGCLQDEIRIKTHSLHKKSKTRLYNIWCGIKGRCFNPNEQAYKLYGARGISICDEWKSSYENFEKWALQSGYKETLTLDRKNVNGDYKPSNCRWITMQEQQNNRRNNNVITYKGQTHTTAEWARLLGMNYHTLQTRLHRNKWSVEKAFTTPVKTR